MDIPPTQALWKALKYLPRSLWLLACGFMVFLGCYEIVYLKTHPEEYAPLWGAEAVGGIWYYASESAYLLSGAVETCWFLTGVLLCLNKGIFRRPRLLVAHVALTAIWVFLSWLFMPSVE